MLLRRRSFCMRWGNAREKRWQSSRCRGVPDVYGRQQAEEPMVVAKKITFVVLTADR